MGKHYAVVRKWKDNPTDFEVVEYVDSVKEGQDYIKYQKKSERYDWDVMKYV